MKLNYQSNINAIQFVDDNRWLVDMFPSLTEEEISDVSAEYGWNFEEALEKLLRLSETKENTENFLQQQDSEEVNKLYEFITEVTTVNH